jgi:hypothetical protein
MKIASLILLGLYLLAGAAVWTWIRWRRRRKPSRGKARQQPQEFPLLTAFLLLLTWPLTVWEEVRRRR